MGGNQFGNVVLREFAADAPQYARRLRVATGDASRKDNKLQINQEFLQANANNLNSAFNQQLEKLKFFDLVKKRQRQLSDKEREDLDNVAIMEFYDSCPVQKALKGVDPSCLEIINNTWCMNDKNISLQEAKALRDYFRTIKDRPEKQVSEVIIDSCGMKDHVFEQVLDGVVGQAKQAGKGSGTRPVYQLAALIYQSNCIGMNSAGKVVKLLQDLVELKLSNLTASASAAISIGAVLEELLSHLTYLGRYLRKLTLSRLDLSREKLWRTTLHIM